MPRWWRGARPRRGREPAPRPLHGVAPDDGPTRLGALRGLGRLYTVLGDAALMHVPNAVPFVTELVEDGEEDVRAEAAATLKQLEGLAKEEFDVDRERAVARR